MTAYANTALWRQIETDLRGQIAAMDPGDPLPSDPKLAGSYGVARATVRQALLELERAGLVTPGRPRRVAAPPALVTVHVARDASRTARGEAATAGADSWLADMLRAGRVPTQRIEVVTEAAGAEVAARLEIPPAATVTARRLVRLAAGQVHNLITFWFPQRVAAGTPLAEPADISEGSVAWLETETGPLQHEVDVSAWTPTASEQDALAIAASVPVLIVWRVSRAELPVMCSKAVYPANRARLRLEP